MFLLQLYQIVLLCIGFQVSDFLEPGIINPSYLLKILLRNLLLLWWICILCDFVFLITYNILYSISLVFYLQYDIDLFLSFFSLTSSCAWRISPYIWEIFCIHLVENVFYAFNMKFFSSSMLMICRVVKYYVYPVLLVHLCHCLHILIHLLCFCP